MMYSFYVSLLLSLVVIKALLTVGEQFAEEAYIEADVIGFDGSIDQSAEEKPSEKPTLKRKNMDEADQYRYDVRKEQTHSSQQYGPSPQNSRGDVKRQVPGQTHSSQQFGPSPQNSRGDVKRQVPGQTNSSQQYGSSPQNSRGDVKRLVPEQTNSSQQYGSNLQNSRGDLKRQTPEQTHSSQQYGSSPQNPRGDVKRQIPEQTYSSQQYGSSPQNPRGDVKRQIPNNQEILKGGGEQKVEKKEEFIEDKFGLVKVGNRRLVNIESLILPQEKKHGGRSRLFVANLASGVSESDLKELFEQFGDVSEVFVNKEKGFGFVRLVRFSFFV